MDINCTMVVLAFASTHPVSMRWTLELGWIPLPIILTCHNCVTDILLALQISYVLILKLLWTGIIQISSYKIILKKQNEKKFISRCVGLHMRNIHGFFSKTGTRTLLQSFSYFILVPLNFFFTHRVFSISKILYWFKPIQVKYTRFVSILLVCFLTSLAINQSFNHWLGFPVHNNAGSSCFKREHSADKQ